MSLPAIVILLDYQHLTHFKTTNLSIHGFSGDSTALKDWLALGFYVSIGIRGFVTNGTPSLQAVVLEIPLDRLLTETDSASSGQPAGPADLPSVVEKKKNCLGDKTPCGMCPAPLA